MHDEPMIHGTVDPAFSRVREAFAQVATRERGLSAQLCIYHRGAPMVDLWTGPDVLGDSLMAVYSSSKGAAYLVIGLLIQGGLIDPAASVSTYWPELLAAKDPAFTVADLLGHRAGLIGVTGGFTFEEGADDARVAARLEQQEPYWQPGSAHGYHALTNGALAGEIARRVTGQSLQQIFERRIRAPYDIDFYLGLPAEEDHRYLTVQPPLNAGNEELPDPNSFAAIAMNQHAPEPTNVYTFPNERLVREKGQSSGGGIGSARGLARMYAAAIGLDGQDALLNDTTIRIVSTPQRSGIDQVFGFETRFLLGFGAIHATYPMVGPQTFGHNGAAGSLAFADPDAGLAYGYTRRRFCEAGFTPEEQNGPIIAAMVECALSA